MKILRHILLFAFSFTIIISCKTKSNTAENAENTSNHPIYLAAIKFSREKTWWYNADYYKIPYPNGDVPSGGACSDVIIRALRESKMDLQQLIHEDMQAHFDEYPKKWGLTAPDANIDHRRVPNMMKYFEKMRYTQPISNNYADYKPGDIVCWNLSPTTTHIGIVLNNKGDVYHNMGPKATISEDFLFDYTIIGHYRINEF